MRCDEATLVEARGASTDSIDVVNISASRAEGYDVRKRWLAGRNAVVGNEPANRKIGEPHVDAGLEQTRQEGDRAGKPVDFGHDQRHLMHPSRGQCLVLV
jgi:hypothetical protein